MCYLYLWQDNLVRSQSAEKVFKNHKPKKSKLSVESGSVCITGFVTESRPFTVHAKGVGLKQRSRNLIQSETLLSYFILNCYCERKTLIWSHCCRRGRRFTQFSSLLNFSFLSPFCGATMCVCHFWPRLDLLMSVSLLIGQNMWP